MAKAQARLMVRPGLLFYVVGMLRRDRMKICARRFIQFILVGLMVWTLGLMAANAQNNSGLRVVHALPKSPPADVYVDGQLFFANVTYRAISDYRLLAGGNHRIKILPAGASSEGQGLIEADFSFVAGKNYSLVAMGTGGEGGAELRLFEDDNSSPPAGKARVRAMHASPDTPAVDVCVTGYNNCPVSDLTFKNATVYVNLDPGTYSFELRRRGTNEIILLVPSLEFKEGVVYTLFLMGFLQGEPGLQIITSADSIRAPVEPPTTGALLSPTALIVIVIMMVMLMVACWFAWRRFSKKVG
ncbi:MAG: DUF4397 domain-containing protein [Anaerolineae bacterium]|nr:DUF4397 domain-containing protein [Anaerolineae bacterium]